MSEPLWLSIAVRDIGLKEIKGSGTEPRIAAWLKQLKAWWDDDETPWCGTAVAAWMKEAGVEIPQHWYRAKGWLDWGVPMDHPATGCVVVFERTGGGHVGLATGRTATGQLLILGGNQGDAVNIKPFALDRVLGYRWPIGSGYAPNMPLAVVASTATLSTNEA